MFTSLQRAQLVNRELFDPTDASHVASLMVFLQTGDWGEMQFYPELPYIEVPMTVLTKYACHTLGVQREGQAEREARLAATKPDLRYPNYRHESKKAHAKRLALASAMVLNQLKQLIETKTEEDDAGEEA
jgi:hypothetical protein